MYANRDVIPVLEDQINKSQMKVRRNNNGKKYFIDLCQDKINKTPNNSTEEWLLISKVLKEKVAIKSFLKIGSFDTEHVVVKIGKYDSLYREYLRSKLLFENNLIGFVNYICFFQCPDKISNYTINTNKETFCNGDGPLMSAIVMPFINGNSLEHVISQQSITFDQVKIYIRNVMINLHNAFYSVGFIHQDTHLNNILIHNNNAVLIDYGDSFVIPIPSNNKLSDEAFIHYHSMHLDDYIKILTELRDVYRKLISTPVIKNLTELLVYLFDTQEYKRVIDFDNFIKQIENMKLLS